MLGWPWPPGPPPPPASLPGATPGGSSGTAWIRRISLLAAQGAGADPSGSVPDKVRLILGQIHSGPSGQVSPSLISSPATPAGGGNPFALGQLPPPGSKGLSSGHWENPSRSPPTAEIHQHSHPRPVLPGSKGSGTGNLPPLPLAPEPPPIPSSPRSSTGHHFHSSTAKPNTSVAQWDSWEACGASTHPCLAALAVLVQPQHSCTEDFCYCVLSLPGNLFSRQIQPFLTGGIPKAEHSASFVSVTPRAALELLRHVWPWRSGHTTGSGGVTACM